MNRYLRFFCLVGIIFVVGCQNSIVAQNDDSNISEFIGIDIPEDASQLKIEKIDFQNDGVDEYFQKYFVYKNGQTNGYLEVFSFNGSDWQRIFDKSAGANGRTYDFLDAVSMKLHDGRDVLLTYYEVPEVFEDQVISHKELVIWLWDGYEYVSYLPKPNFDQFFLEEEFDEDVCSINLVDVQVKEESFHATYNYGCKDQLYFGFRINRIFNADFSYVDDKFEYTIEEKMPLNENAYGRKGDYYVINDYLFMTSPNTGVSKVIADRLIKVFAYGGEDLIVWHTFHDSGYDYIYFASVAGCGGCIALEHKYVVLDVRTNEVQFRELDTNSELFKKGGSVQTMFSDDGRKMVYIQSDLNFGLEQDIPEEIWVYDFLNDAWSLQETLKVGETVMCCGMGCYPQKQFISWNAVTQQFDVNPHSRQDALDGACFDEES